MGSWWLPIKGPECLRSFTILKMMSIFLFFRFSCDFFTNMLLSNPDECFFSKVFPWMLFLPLPCCFPGPILGFIFVSLYRFSMVHFICSYGFRKFIYSIDREKNVNLASILALWASDKSIPCWYPMDKPNMYPKLSNILTCLKSNESSPYNLRPILLYMTQPMFHGL